MYRKISELPNMMEFTLHVRHGLIRDGQNQKKLFFFFFFFFFFSSKENANFNHNTERMRHTYPHCTARDS